MTNVNTYIYMYIYDIHISERTTFLSIYAPNKQKFRNSFISKRNTTY